MAKSNSQVFYRLVRAPKGHPFSGLWGVEKVIVKGNTIVAKELVHEWDLRILSESCLSRIGGSSAYEAFVCDNGDPEDITGLTSAEVVPARTEEDLKDLTQRKLNKELRAPK
jgi:hypothetical protein